MQKCYQLLGQKFGLLSTLCMKCEYWKKSIKGSVTIPCYEYFDCKAECPFKNGRVPNQSRIKSVPAKEKKKKGLSDEGAEAVAQILKMMMDDNERG